MRKQLLVSFFVSMLMFCVFVPQSSEALLVNPGVFYTVDNGNYSVAAPMVFNQVHSMAGHGSGVYFVTIRVVDEGTMLPIAGALVTLEDVSVRTTDSLGEVVFYFLMGTYYPYDLRVSAKGYADFSQVVRFNDSSTLTVNLSAVGGHDKGIPGFEFVFAVASVAVCMLVWKKKMVVKRK